MYRWIGFLALVAFVLFGLWVTSVPAPAQGYDEEATRGAQAELARRGYKIDVDGIMGSDTRSILRDFQRDNDLPETGALDVATSRKLFSGEGNLDLKAPAADDAAYQDREKHDREIQLCKPAAIEEIGAARPIQRMALGSARQNWARKARFQHGELFSDPENARIVEDTCTKSSVGTFITNYRCVFRAFPCRAGS